MSRFLITWDDRNNYSTRLDPAICALLIIREHCRKNGAFGLGNPCFVRWTTGTTNNCDFRFSIADCK